MDKMLPEKKYERNMYHNYLILQETKHSDHNTYIKKMVTGNEIDGLMKMKVRFLEGQEVYYYEMKSMQSIDRIYERKNIGLEPQITIIRSYISLQKHLEEYLLSSENVILNPSFVYMNPTDMTFSFILFPEYVKDSREAFREFMEYILNKIDHTEEEAVMLAYQLYKYTREENYLLEGICEILNQHDHGKQRDSRYHEVPQIEKETVSENIEPTTTYDFQQMHAITQSQHEEETLYENEMMEEGSEKHKRNHRMLSVFCAMGAVICLAVIFLSKMTTVLSLSEEYEMIVFGMLMMLAVSGILFNKLVYKQKEQTDAMQEIEVEQITRMQDNFTKKDTYVAPEDIGLEPPKEVIHEFFKSPAETTVLGEDNILVENRLYRRDGNHREQYHINRFPFVIGRMQSYVDLLLEDTSISKMHARIEKQDGKIYIQDMNSTNGTQKNGQYLVPNQLTELLPGDEIRMGRVVFSYE